MIAVACAELNSTNDELLAQITQHKNQAQRLVDIHDKIQKFVDAGCPPATTCASVSACEELIGIPKQQIYTVQDQRRFLYMWCGKLNIHHY